MTALGIDLKIPKAYWYSHLSVRICSKSEAWIACRVFVNETHEARVELMVWNTLVLVRFTAVPLLSTAMRPNRP
jgi:hypothetical protein